MPQKEIYDIHLQVLKITEKAVLVTEGITDENGKQKNHWLPLSQIEGDLEEGKICEIQIPRWLIEEKGLIV